MPSWTSCFTSSITQAENEHLKCHHQFFIRWFACDVPYLWDKLLPVKKQCTAAISLFSNPQSVFDRFGHKPCTFIVLKYKADGMIELIFDLTTFKHRIFLENTSTLPCIGKPYCLIFRNHHNAIEHLDHSNYKFCTLNSWITVGEAKTFKDI